MRNVIIIAFLIAGLIYPDIIFCKEPTAMDIVNVLVEQEQRVEDIGGNIEVLTKFKGESVPVNEMRQSWGS